MGVSSLEFCIVIYFVHSDGNSKYEYMYKCEKSSYSSSFI
jgi:hypothetical protein